MGEQAIRPMHRRRTNAVETSLRAPISPNGAGRKRRDQPEGTELPRHRGVPPVVLDVKRAYSPARILILTAHYEKKNTVVRVSSSLSRICYSDHIWDRTKKEGNSFHIGRNWEGMRRTVTEPPCEWLRWQPTSDRSPLSGKLTPETLVVLEAEEKGLSQLAATDRSGRLNV